MHTSFVRAIVWLEQQPKWRFHLIVLVAVIMLMAMGWVACQWAAIVDARP